MVQASGNFKHSYNRDYFEKIDTAEKAYWLGFILADGNIQDNRRKPNKSTSCQIRIRLQKSDKGHLEKFKNALNAVDTKVKIVKNYGNISKNMNDECLINFYSKKLVDDLIDKNIDFNKSMYERPYYDLNENFLSDYIRGYYDGDGYISLGKAPEIGFLSSKEMCDFIEKVLYDKVNGIFIQKRSYNHTQIKVNRVRTSNQLSISGILDFMYYPGCVCLDRKYKSAKNYLNRFKIIKNI